MTLSVQEIFDRVSRQFGDEAGSQVKITDVTRWINDAMREIVHKNKLLQVKATTDTMVGVPAYALPTDISKLHSIKYKGITLRPMSIAEADQQIGALDVSVANGYPTGTPTRYWIWAQQVNLYPAPDTAVDEGLVAYYSRTPVAVVNVGDVPELPDEYHNRIVDYCLAQAFEIDENFSVAQSKMANFEQKVAAANDISEEQQETYPYITDVEDFTLA